MKITVELDLRTARALRDLLVLPPMEHRSTELERAIARAERENRPGRWAVGTRWWYGGRRRAACVDRSGWRVWARNGKLIDGGPETGAAGRDKADRTLSRWLGRRGVDWSGGTR